MGKSEGTGEEDQTEEPEPVGTVFRLPEEILSTALPVLHPCFHNHSGVSDH